MYYTSDDIRYLNILDIKPYYYRITRDGKIINKDGYVMKSFYSNRNYERISLRTNNGRSKKYSIHRLVALVYVPNDNPQKTIVNHKDGKTHNNDYSNLEWVTNSENMIHAYDNNLAYTKGTNCHLSKSDKYPDELVHDICKMLQNGASSPEIILALNLCDSINYKNKKYNNYRHYINDLRKRRLRRDITSQYTF